MMSNANVLKKRGPITSGTDIGSSSCAGRRHCPFLNSRFSAAKKRRLIHAAKTLLDTASDDGPPLLKSCLGRISALIEYCEVRCHGHGNFQDDFL